MLDSISDMDRKGVVNSSKIITVALAATLVMSFVINILQARYISLLRASAGPESGQANIVLGTTLPEMHLVDPDDRNVVISFAGASRTVLYSSALPVSGVNEINEPYIP